MVGEYENYCSNPTIATASELLAVIVNDYSNNHVNRELFEIWKFGIKAKHKHITINTSGSTSGKPRPYTFGPLHDFWFKGLESATKYPTNHKPVLLRDKSFEGYVSNADSVGLLMVANEPHYSGFLTVPYLNDRMVDKLCKRIDELIELQINVKISANPNIWLYLTSNRLFIDYIIEHKSNVSLLSTNWESFFKKREIVDSGVFINDTMINWHNGMNFYTCEHGNKHSIPLSIVDGDNVINLINLTGHVGTLDDAITIGERCLCGRDCLSIIPHTYTQPVVDGKMIYNLGLIELLESQFNNLQFVQNNNKIDVHYVCDELIDSDKDVIASHVGEVDFHDRSFLRITNKLPSFYNNLSGVESTDYKFRKPVHDIPFI